MKSPDVVATDLLVAIADEEALRLPFMEGGHIPEIVRLIELPTGNVRVIRNLLKILARLSVNGTTYPPRLFLLCPHPPLLRFLLLLEIRCNYEVHDSRHYKRAGSAEE